jgi:hypothetical protein
VLETRLNLPGTTSSVGLVFHSAPAARQRSRGGVATCSQPGPTCTPATRPSIHDSWLYSLVLRCELRHLNIDTVTFGAILRARTKRPLRASLIPHGHPSPRGVRMRMGQSPYVHLFRTLEVVPFSMTSEDDPPEKTSEHTESDCHAWSWSWIAEGGIRSAMGP